MCGHLWTHFTRHTSSSLVWLALTSQCRHRNLATNLKTKIVCFLLDISSYINVHWPPTPLIGPIHPRPETELELSDSCLIPSDSTPLAPLLFSGKSNNTTLLWDVWPFLSRLTQRHLAALIGAGANEASASGPNGLLACLLAQAEAAGKRGTAEQDLGSIWLPFSLPLCPPTGPLFLS